MEKGPQVKLAGGAKGRIALERVQRSRGIAKFSDSSAGAEILCAIPLDLLSVSAFSGRSGAAAIS